MFPECPHQTIFQHCVTSRKTEGFIQELISFELRFEGPDIYVKYFQFTQNGKRQIRTWEKNSPIREGKWPQFSVLYSCSWSPIDVRNKHTEAYNKVRLLWNKDKPICFSLVPLLNSPLMLLCVHEIFEHETQHDGSGFLGYDASSLDELLQTRRKMYCFNSRVANYTKDTAFNYIRMSFLI